MKSEESSSSDMKSEEQEMEASSRNMKSEEQGMQSSSTNMKSEEQEIESSSRKRKAEDNGLVNFTVDHARKILDAFTHKQLMEIVQEAAKEHRDVREQVRSIADKNTAARKLFVRGLSSETNSESLNAVFSPFGELVESVVIMDKNTGKSKGYGFVTFAHVDGALNALKEPSKRIDGRMTVTQYASGGFQPSQPHVDVNARKIYVGNVPVGMDADRLVSFFSQYGEIEQGPLGFDKHSGRSRGYALFIFKTVEAAKRALEEPSKTMDDGHQLSCKLANERHNPKPGRVNSTTTANWSDIHPLNHTATKTGIIPSQVSDYSHQGFREPNSNYHYMNQISSTYAYGIPQSDGYFWGHSTAGNGFTYGAQPTSGL